MGEDSVLLAFEALAEPMEHAVLRRAKSAQLAALDVAAVQALEPCPTLDVVRDRTCRRRLISTWDAEVTSMPCAQGEISPASSPLAAC